MPFWRKNGHIVGINGIPIECDECPCGRACIIHAKSEKKRLLGTGLYSLVSEMGDNYNCAEFGRDDHGNAVCTRQAEGTLVQVLQRYRNVPENLSLEGRYLVYAVTLQNRQDGSYLTIGCECQMDFDANSCNHQYVELENHCISDEVNVLHKEDMSMYAPEDSCKPIPCEAGSLLLSTYGSWYGGTLHPEGFCVIYELNGREDIEFTAFRRLLEYEYEDSSTRMRKAVILDCDCELEESDFFSRSMIDTMRRIIVQCPNACSSDCVAYEFLKSFASHEGMEFHEEGVVAHLAGATMHEDGEPTTVHADWYDADSCVAYKACVQFGNGMYVVPCDCDGSTTILRIDNGSLLQNAKYNKYLELEDACFGIDRRELLLLYPDVFGIEDVSWGSNTKYRHSLRYMADDWVWNEDTQEYDVVEVERVDEGCSACGSVSPIGGGGGSDFYLDYRTMCFISKELDSNGQTKHRVEWISPSGSPSGSSRDDQLYDSAEFAGHMEPFEYDVDVRCNWTGQYLQWDGSCGGNEAAYFDTQGEAEDYCSSHNPSKDCMGVCGRYAYDIPYRTRRISPPLQEYWLVPGEVRFEDWCSKWSCTPPHYELGEETVADGRKYYIVYREQWIDTNRGLLRYGEDGYADSIMVYGIQGSIGNPNWGNCYGHSGVPTQDMEVHAQIVDEDFHEQNGHTSIEDLYNAGQDDGDEIQE